MLGKEAKEHLRKRGMKQNFVARYLGISDAKYSLYLRNKANLTEEEQSKQDIIFGV